MNFVQSSSAVIYAPSSSSSSKIREMASMRHFDVRGDWVSPSDRSIVRVGNIRVPQRHRCNLLKDDTTKIHHCDAEGRGKGVPFLITLEVSMRARLRIVISNRVRDSECFKDEHSGLVTCVLIIYCYGINWCRVGIMLRIETRTFCWK